MNGCKTVPTVRTLSDPPAMEIFCYPPSNFRLLCLLDSASLLARIGLHSSKVFKLWLTNFQPGVVMMLYNCVRIPVRNFHQQATFWNYKHKPSKFYFNEFPSQYLR